MIWWVTGILVAATAGSRIPLSAVPVAASEAKEPAVAFKAAAGVIPCRVAIAGCPKVYSTADKKAATRLRNGGTHGRGFGTHQPVLQLGQASRRRSRALSTSPVIADSCDDSLALSSLSSDGSLQPLTSESSIARWSIAYRGPCIDLHRSDDVYGCVEREC